MSDSTASSPSPRRGRDAHDPCAHPDRWLTEGAYVTDAAGRRRIHPAPAAAVTRNRTSAHVPQAIDRRGIRNALVITLIIGLIALAIGGGL